MKFQTRMILYYTTIALILSFTLGAVVYVMSLRYEEQSRKNQLLITSRQLISQMEERLNRMDAIMNYILSEPSMLEHIKVLGGDVKEEDAGYYVKAAESSLRTGMNTDFIIRNSYRTAFFNQNGYLISSYAQSGIKTLVNQFEIDSIPYLKEAADARGKSVLIGVHTDRWGPNEHTQVYSLVKAIQGFQLGFLEVENTVLSLGELKVPDEHSGYIIFTENGEILYASNNIKETENYKEIYEKTEKGSSRREGTLLVARAESEAYSLGVLTVDMEGWTGNDVILMTAVLSSLIVFAVGLFLIIFWSHILIKPMKRLRNIMENTTLESLGETQTIEYETAEPDDFQLLTMAYQSMTERLDQALRNEKRASLLWLQAQFDTLQAQVNPHFLYNVLNIISSKSVMLEDESISEMCAALAHILRYSTNNKERYATVEQEIEYLNNYLYLLQERYGNRLYFSVNVDQKVKEEVIPKLVLQQIVENCISHGFANNSGFMRVDIKGEVTDRGWVVSIIDNGCGIEEDVLKQIRDKLESCRKEILGRRGSMEMEIGGMGIINTYTRCLILYQEDLIFHIQNMDCGVRVDLGCTKREEIKNED